jgi:hypothetical protein
MKDTTATRGGHGMGENVRNLPPFQGLGSAIKAGMREEPSESAGK